MNNPYSDILCSLSLSVRVECMKKDHSVHSRHGEQHSSVSPRHDLNNPILNLCNMYDAARYYLQVTFSHLACLACLEESHDLLPRHLCYLSVVCVKSMHSSKRFLNSYLSKVVLIYQ